MKTLKVTEKYVDDSLYKLHRSLFESVLAISAQNADSFEQRLKRFEYFGLLDFYSKAPFNARPLLEQYIENDNGERIYAFAEKQLARPHWKGRFIRRLRAQRPSVYMRYRLEVKRDAIINDKKYVKDIATILAYKWVGLLGRPDSEELVTVMRLMDAAALVHFLDNFQFTDLSLSCIKLFLMRREVEMFLDNNQSLVDLHERIEVRLKLAGSVSKTELGRLDVSTLPKLDLEELLAPESDRCKFVDRIRSWSEERKNDVSKMLLRSTRSELTQESFQRAVYSRIARKKAARMRLARMRASRPFGSMYHLAPRVILVFVTLLFVFYIKIGHSQFTIVDLISRWLQ